MYIKTDYYYYYCYYSNLLVLVLSLQQCNKYVTSSSRQHLAYVKNFRLSEFTLMKKVKFFDLSMRWNISGSPYIPSLFLGILWSTNEAELVKTLCELWKS